MEFSDQLPHYVPAAAPDDPGKSEQPAVQNDAKPKDAETAQPVDPRKTAPESEADAETSAKDEADDGDSANRKFPKDPRLDLQVMMEYGTTARPPIKGLDLNVAGLSVELIAGGSSSATKKPTVSSQLAPQTADGTLRRDRVVFVGDVHGERAALERLLEKIRFNAARDHLVLTGDLVNKGPDSAGVVDLAMALGASAVRGSHEDRVLLAYESLHAARASPQLNRARSMPETVWESTEALDATAVRQRKQADIQAERLQEEDEPAHRAGRGFLASLLGDRGKPAARPDRGEEDTLDLERINSDLLADPLEQNPFTHGDGPERATAAALTAEQHRWLASLPTVLRLGRIGAPGSGASAPFDDVVVAHAGLVPNVPLARQDPLAVLTMRSLVHPADEVRRDYARAVLEMEARARSGGRVKPTDGVYVSAAQVDAAFRRLQHAAYGPDLQHPRADLDATVAADLVLLPIEGHFRHPLGPGEGVRLHWAAAWNQAQHARPPDNRTTVVYGHDAVTGLAVPPDSAPLSSASASLLGRLWGSVAGARRVATVDSGYTFGLDSGCVYGGQLTALVVEADPAGRTVHHVEQVDCAKSAMQLD